MTKNYDNNDEKTSTSTNNAAQNMPQHSHNSHPQSPQEQILEFINTLGEHVMDEVMSNVSSHTEKGDEAGSAGHAGGEFSPPGYSFTAEKQPAEKTGETSTHAHRGETGEPSGSSSSSASASAAGSGSGDRNNRSGQHQQRRGEQGGWGPWGGNWRDQQQFNPFGGWGAMFSGLGGTGTYEPGTSFPLNSNEHPFPNHHESFTNLPGQPTSACGPPPMMMGGGFPFGGRGGGRGGHCGGRGGGHYGGPWGWKSRRHWGNRGGADDQNFTPAADIFDTPNAFVVHVALPGALKEDIGINYDFDKSELQISGVVHRPGNEEFLAHLVDGERRVGAFDRKIKLESKGKNVAVDADAITAKLENGLLEVTVPKLRRSDEPEKRKIRID